MTPEDMRELAKSAAHSAVISVGQPNEQFGVDRYICML